MSDFGEILGKLSQKPRNLVHIPQVLNKKIGEIGDGTVRYSIHQIDGTGTTIQIIDFASDRGILPTNSQGEDLKISPSPS